MRHSARILCAVIVLGTAAYWPGLSGDFVFDDIPNITDNRALRPAALTLESLASAALSAQSGPLKRPLAYLSFMANYRFFGPAPRSFKVVNLLIHVCNGWLVFLLLRRLVPAFIAERTLAISAAGFCALAWTLHPLNLTAVLLVVQRMTSLAATFVLLALLCYCAARQNSISRPERANRSLWLGVATFGAGGLATKENAVLLPLFALTVELTVFNFRAAQWLKPAYISGLLIAAVALVYVLGPLDYLHTAYHERQFTANERLLTELRILVSYLGQILVPDPTRMSLLNDNVTLSRGLWEPATTAAAAAFWMIAIGVSVATRRRTPVILFGAGWYLTGHLLESTFVPLELIFEHRNYLAMLGPLCLVTVGLTRATESSPSLRTLLAGGVILILSAMTAYRSWQWSDSFTLALMEARHSPTSARAHIEFGRANFEQFLIEKRPDLLATARRELRAAIKFGDEDFQPLVSLVNSYILNNEPVPEEAIRALEHAMQSGLPVLRWLDGIILSINCQIAKRCPPTPGIVLRVVAAALENPRLQPKEKAEILEWLALYYANVLGDLAAASNVMQDAVQTQPDNWAYRLRWAEIMAEQHAWKDANREVEELSSTVTKFVRYANPELAKRLDTLRAKLTAHE